MLRRPMHLAILTQILDRQDAVLGFFHTWCEVFAQHVDQLTVYAQSVGDVDLPPNVRVRSLGRESGSGKLGMALRLMRGMGLARPSAVWVHMVPKFALYAAPLALPSFVPMYLWYTHKGVDTSLRMATPLVRKVFTASEESFRLQCPPEKVVVTGHGIDCVHFDLPAGGREVDVLAVGRLSPTKAQDVLLDALALLPSVPRTEIAGDILLEKDAPYRDALFASARELGDGVRFLGAVPYVRVADAMRRAKVLVNTSHTGSVDKVVLEAMACGTVPLTCNESFERIFGHELAARLMFDKGDPAGLARRLDEVLSLDAGELAGLGARLRDIVVREHDVRVLVPRMVAVMEGR